MSEKTGKGPTGKESAEEVRIGHYTIVSELGRGGMGVVYKAHEESLNRLVALKVLGKHLSEDETFVARFKREAQSAAALNHPNIVQVYAIAEFDGEHCFAMEFVRGSSVQQLIRANGPMEPVKAARLVLQAASGLGAAHEKGIYHRDIKPANLMLDENGLLKIADFGLAILAAGTTQLTATGMFMGTPGYLSPEQCLGESVDQRTDIYALGVTLYEMLTGVTPLKADSPLALLRQIIDVEPRDVGELRPEVPESLRVILRKMMAKRPEDRYLNCSSLIMDLQLWLAAVGAKVADPNDETVIAPVQKTSENTVEAPIQSASISSSKRNSMSALIIALALLVVAGASYGTWRYIEHQSEPETVVDAGSDDTGSGVQEQLEEESGIEEAQLDENTQLFVDSNYPETDPEGEIDELELLSPQGGWSDELIELDSEEMLDKGDLYASAITPTSNAAASNTTTSNTTTSNVAAADTAASNTATNRPEVPTPMIGTGVALVSVGEILLANSASDYVRQTLSRHGIAVVDGMSIPGVADMLENGGGDLQSLIRPTARYLVYIRADFVGERELYYMGRPDIEIQSRLNLETHDLLDGQSMGEGVHASVGYTALSVENKVQELLRPRFGPVATRLVN